MEKKESHIHKLLREAAGLEESDDDSLFLDENEAKKRKRQAEFEIHRTRKEIRSANNNFFRQKMMQNHQKSKRNRGRNKH